MAVVVTGLAYVALVPANVLLTITFPVHLRASIFAVLGASLAVMQALMALAAGVALERFGVPGLIWLCTGLAALAVLVLGVGATMRRPEPLVQPPG